MFFFLARPKTLKGHSENRTLFSFQSTFIRKCGAGVRRLEGVLHRPRPSQEMPEMRLQSAALALRLGLRDSCLHVFKPRSKTRFC